ncbi:MAG: hypothetical protein JO356_11480 [Acidobacteria bacterium]|nr:hypothetical protein [Acidobacteriota bacterium]
MVATANRGARAWDDELFTKVLSSAYSLQQQHDRVQSKLPAVRLSEILAEVINTQSLIRNRKLDCETAMHLVASRTEKLSGAAGAAIAVLDGETLDYKVGTGIAASLCGFRSRAQEIISFERLKSDQLAETDTWQEKVLGGRLVANVLSAPIYRQGELAGCIQLFSRHGHFDFDGRYVCELMSGIVSQVIEKMPHSELAQSQEQSGILRFDPVAARESQSLGDFEKPVAGGKLEWPASDSTRQLEAKLKKAAKSVNPEQTGIESGSSSLLPDPVSDIWSNEAEVDAETSIVRSKPGGKDRTHPLIVRTPPPHGPSVGSLALVPNENRVPHLMPKLTTENDRLRSEIRDERSRGEHLAVAPGALQPKDQAVRSGSEHGEGGGARGAVWNRSRRLIYPIFVLLFAIGVRIRAGAHNWPVEIVVYVLLVLTTLELQSRWSKR